MKNKLKLSYIILVAAALWFVMFSPWTKMHVNFWLTMAFSGVVLITLSLLAGNQFWKKFHFSWRDLIIGIASAAFMWVVFWIGNFISIHLFHFAAPQVSAIYGLKSGSSLVMIALLLLFIIGPAEEIFWRGFVMERMTEKWGPWIGFAVATLVYAAIHIWAFNFMLFMAALICGTFWGLLYKYNRNMFTIIISHALWDVMVFVVFPI
ncbi:CPBP family intramembrane glutamic endopeptidase [Lactococcus fujiensis]|uniref:CAAX amino terminal protease n=1 Tax=Lactococcus fujiensis JCM 16395 TaxID=1291764 RepID=A0A2A5RKJ4_9LACT|nr:type II CAAX endopeptidase family protein [Lactococcus fujiensis]PCR99689.1 CAAX amino terminal protease [Lactococcus fujiensis JCM 16395]